MKFNKQILQVLSPYGEWQHHKGLQIVDKESAMKMKKSSIFSLFATIPIYIGHPDESKTRKKHKIVGRIDKILKLENCIAILASYSDEIYEKITNGTYKAMSPRWEMQQIDNDKYRPVKLISAGLTNNPNIPHSGDILKADSVNNNFQIAPNSKEKIFNKLIKLKENLRECKEQATSFKESLNSLKIDIRISKQKNEFSHYNDMKITMQNLPYVALERSKALGEPYTTSFAILKQRAI